MRVAIVLILAVASWAGAWNLQVDPSGGPLVLLDHVEAVVEDWSAAGADVEGTDRTVVVRYGDPARLGPDAIVLVVVRPDTGDFDLLVHPDADGVRAALVPAFGVVLGGVPGPGALDPRIDVAAPRIPTPTDVVALRGTRSELPGDLDGDGLVDFEDLLLLAAAYGRQGVNVPEDLDGDGVVGDADLELLRELYTFAGTASSGGEGAEGTERTSEPDASMDELPPDAADDTDVPDPPASSD